MLVPQNFDAWRLEHVKRFPAQIGVFRASALLLCERRRVGRLLLMMCVMNFNAYMCFRPSVNINNLSVATASLEVPVESVPLR